MRLNLSYGYMLIIGYFVHLSTLIVWEKEKCYMVKYIFILLFLGIPRIITTFAP